MTLKLSDALMNFHGILMNRGGWPVGSFEAKANLIESAQDLEQRLAAIEKALPYHVCGEGKQPCIDTRPAPASSAGGPTLKASGSWKARENAFVGVEHDPPYGKNEFVTRDWVERRPEAREAWVHFVPGTQHTATCFGEQCSRCLTHKEPRSRVLEVERREP